MRLPLNSYELLLAWPSRDQALWSKKQEQGDIDVKSPSVHKGVAAMRTELMTALESMCLQAKQDASCLAERLATLEKTGKKTSRNPIGLVRFLCSAGRTSKKE